VSDAARVVRADPTLAPAVAGLFERLHAEGVEDWFHPHPLTAAEAEHLCAAPGRDVYLIALRGTRAVGYGLLRGWNEGFDVPSLGVVVDSDVRGQGVGRLLMDSLHDAARSQGAERIRLKVYPQNVKALRLYRDLGYVFQVQPEHGQLVGFLDLER
jgi:ribosomal protein S18 acetylase RimI-like enzyme